ncbi:hypothetical protein [Streptomyces sp. NPDC004376]
MAVPLGVGGAALLGVGACTSVYLYRRKARGASDVARTANES